MLTTEDRAVLKAAEDIILRECAEDGGECSLRGFGVFRRFQTKPKVGRNPKTGEAVQVPAKSVLRFKVSKTLSK